MEASTLKINLYPKSHSLFHTWYIEYSINGGVRKKKYGRLNHLPTVTERLREADRLRKIIEEENSSEIVLSSKKVNELLDILSAQFESHALSLKKKSEQTYRSKFDEFCRWMRLYRNMEEVRRLGLATAFIKYLKAKELSATTINTYIETISMLYASSKKLKEENPFDDIKKLREYRKSAKYFSAIQQRELSIEIPNRDPQLWLACQMQYYMLLRPGTELRLLKIQEIDLDEQTARITADDAKNDYTMTVRIPDEFLPQLQFLRNYPDHYYVFGSKGVPGEIAHNKKYFPDRHQAILRQLHYNVDLYKFYSWKHTGAAMYYLATKDIKGLKEQGRWHSLDMVQEYLKNLGILDMEEVKSKFPPVGSYKKISNNELEDLPIVYRKIPTDYFKSNDYYFKQLFPMQLLEEFLGEPRYWPSFFWMSLSAARPDKKIHRNMKLILPEGDAGAGPIE